MDTITDHELLQRHLRGDSDAMAELLTRHAGMVYATARRMAPADAEDVVQAVFLLLWRKAGKLSRMTSLAGWLYRATTYACRNAKKVRGRRDYYEREAAMLHKELVPAGDWELAGPLDGALAQLGEQARQAVLLRYLEGLSAEETAARLGVSAKVAAKRAERAIHKLRAYLIRKGHGVAAANLAIVMANEAGLEVPASVSAGLGKILAGGAAGGKVAELASVAGKGMMMAKAKIAAMWFGLAAGAVIGVVGGVELAGRGPVKTARQPLPPPARVRIVAEDESKVAGSPRVYRHELLVEQGLCQAIVKDAIRVPSQGDWEVYRMPMATLREWVNGAPKGRVDYGYEHQWTVVTPKTAPIAFGVASHSTSFNGVASRIYVDVKDNCLWRMSADDTSVRIPLRENAYEFEINGVPGGVIAKSVKLLDDAVLRPGETLVGVLKLGELQDGEYSLMFALDVFNATDVAAARIGSLYETELWARYGPGLCRRISDRAAEWQKNGHPSDQVSDRWQKTLDDGTVVRLKMLANGARWPGIAWDGDGKAIAVADGTIWSGENRLAVWGDVRSTTVPTSRNMNSRGDNSWGWCNVVTNGSQTYKVRVPVGPFTNAGRLERGKAVQVGPLKIGLRDIEKGDREWQVDIYISGTGRDRLEYVIAPVVVTRNGKRVGPQQNMSEEYFYDAGQDRESSHKEPVSLRFSRWGPLEQEEFDHLELLWRKAEMVTFEGFAAAPLGVDMSDIEQAAREARTPVAGKAAKIAPVESAVAEFPEGQGPADSMQALLAAIAVGQPEEIRKYIIGSTRACDTFVQAMIARSQLTDAIRKQLGAVPEIPLLDHWASLDEYLVDDEYRMRRDGVAVSEHAICRREAEGVWKLDMDESFGREFATTRMHEAMQAAMPMIRELMEDLNSGKIHTENQIREALDAMIKELRTSERM